MALLQKLIEKVLTMSYTVFTPQFNYSQFKYIRKMTSDGESDARFSKQSERPRCVKEHY